jgi:hypothetical protein
MDLDPPADLDELNRRVGPWLDRYVHAVAHRATKTPPATRFAIEKPLLAPLPPVRFDTAKRESRHVARTPLIEWDTVYYSAPPELAGRWVEIRQPVAAGMLELRFAGRLIATHRLAPPGSEPQWLAEHRAAAEAIALGRRGRHLHVVVDEDAPETLPAPRVELGDGDYDVEDPDLDLFGMIGPHPDGASGDEACGCTGGLG